MTNYDNLIDIRNCKRKEKSDRVENAVFFLEQIENHRLFKVGDDVVEISFASTNKTLSELLAGHLRRQNSKSGSGNREN